MTTQQPEVMRLADAYAEASFDQGLHKRTLDDAPEDARSLLAAAVRTQHARITELESQLAQRFDAADMATAAAQGFRDGVASVAASAGEPVAIRPDIQAVLAMLDVPVIARLSSHEGKLLKPGQEPPAFESAVPLVREWDRRRACETIIAALSGRMTKENK